MSANLSTTEVLELAIGPEASYYRAAMLEFPPESRFLYKASGGDLVHPSLDVVTRSMALLMTMDIPTVLVHGAGTQINDIVKEKGLVKREYNGRRVTDDETMDIVESEVRKVNAQVVEALGRRGLDTLPVVSPFIGHKTDPERLGRVGTVDHVDTSLIRSTAKENGVAVVGSLGFDEDGRLLNINADDAVVAIARALNPHRIVTSTGTGGVLDKNGRIIPFIDVDSDNIERLLEDETVTSGMMPKVNAGRELALSQVNGLAVITSPESIIRELFTHEGTGTLFRRGEPIASHTSIYAAERRKLAQLIEAAFKPGVLDSQYFDNLPGDAKLFIVDRGYDGAAIVIPGNQDESGRRRLPAYMDKLAVNEELRGKGIGKQLMRKIVSEHPEGLFWRSRTSNTKNTEFYAQFGAMSEPVGDGGEWRIFTSGIADVLHDYCRRIALSKPETVHYPKNQQ